MARWTVIALVALTACPKSGGDVGGSAASPHPFVAVEIEDDDTLDELAAIELNDVTADCGNLQKLEPAAMLGRLQDGEIRCLDKAFRLAERQTVKDKIGRVLLQDAWARGEEHRWRGIAERHLDQAGRSDPTLCYLLAYQLLHANAPDQMDEVVYWAEMALENRHVWEGDLYVKRVNSLHQTRTLAAQRKWDFLEAQYLNDQSAETAKAKEEARGQVKTYAREWLEYAGESGRDATTALRLCQSAAGHEDFCLDSSASATAGASESP
jgi:hypothetical protein